ncbi:MAG: hypothetical protein R2798_11415 [Chitinophagales bacterium]|nr:hypothetical protein [Bacteroidota bacterium]MCB9043185.1 hypothetical protein [Chitinophagales bacterium]
MKYWLLFVALIGLFCAKVAQAQSTNIPLGHSNYEDIHYLETLSGNIPPKFFSGFQPLAEKQVVNAAEYWDSTAQNLRSSNRQQIYYLYQCNNLWTDWGLLNSKKPFLKKLYVYKTDFFSLNTPEFNLRINPQLNFQMYAQADAPDRLFLNSRGLEIKGNIAQKIGFYTSLSDNQARFPQYIRDYIQDNVAIPYEGRYAGFKGNGLDFFRATGYINFALIPQITITMGQDKHFIGHGERSLLLSDIGNSYPFVKISTRVGNLQYINLYTQYTQQFTSLSDGLKSYKFSANHLLSWNISSKANVSLFESIIFHRNGYDWAYLNPVIFYRFVETQAGSPDNVLIGADMQFLLPYRFQVYGQLIFDEFNFAAIKANNGDWRVKDGFQLGLRWADALGIDNTTWLVEYNQVRPYTYGHVYTYNNYTHYNMPLAHPLGANFRELLSKIIYTPFKKWEITWTGVAARYGKDGNDGDLYGQNIFAPTIFNERTGTYIGQGITTNLLYQSLGVSWEWKHQTFVDAQFVWRRESNENEVITDQFASIGFRMNLRKWNFVR